MAMSANEMNERDDRAFEREIRAAYEEMDPTPEAETRMLAALKAGQAKAAADEKPAAEEIPQAERVTATPIEVQPVKRERKRIAPWKVALPAAACLALAAIGVGVVTQATTPAPSPAPIVASENAKAESSDTGVAEGATGLTANSAPEPLMDAATESDAYEEAVDSGMPVIWATSFAV